MEISENVPVPPKKSSLFGGVRQGRFHCIIVFDFMVDSRRVLTQLFAYLYDGVECFDRKVHSHVHIPKVGQLDACSFVHSGELQLSVRLHSVLIQCRSGPGEPRVTVRPPESVV